MNKNRRCSFVNAKKSKIGIRVLNTSYSLSEGEGGEESKNDLYNNHEMTSKACWIWLKVHPHEDPPMVLA